LLHERSDLYAPSNSFLGSGEFPSLFSQRAGSVFGTVGPFLAGAVVLLVVLILALFMWRRTRRALTPSSNAVEMGVDVEVSGTFQMTSLEDDFAAPTQYQTDSGDGGGHGMMEGLGFGDFQEAIFGF
jgi:hypothetical protein